MRDPIIKEIVSQISRYNITIFTKVSNRKGLRELQITDMKSLYEVLAQMKVEDGTENSGGGGITSC